MKKFSCFVFLCLLAGLLLFTAGCSCGGKENSPSSNGAMSWQENYDLGIRLLAEGNYEEAILAFQAAIQIDPKRVENYIYLADAYIGAGDYEAAADILAQGREHAGSNEAFDRLQENLDFLQSNMVGIRITNFYFDRERFLSGQETDFMVSVVYRCPDDVDCVLMIGTNIHEPYSYAMMNKDWLVSGGGTYSFYISDTPVFWKESPYAIYVNMSDANHGDNWTPFASDILYIDAEGNVTSNDSGPMSDGPYSEWDEPNAEAEHPLVTLFAADPDAGFSIEELTLFGTPIKGLSLEDAATIAQQNGFPGRTTTEGDYTTFSAFYQDDTSPYLSVSRQYPSTTPTVEYISYVHFLTQDDNGNQMRREDSTPVWVGIRSIHTYDTLEQVLSALGYSKSHEIAAQIHDFLQLPEAEARIQLENLWQWGWCCNTNGISHSLDTGLVNGWDFSWYGFDPETETSYTVRFTFDVAADCLTDVYISVY